MNESFQTGLTLLSVLGALLSLSAFLLKNRHAAILTGGWMLIVIGGLVIFSYIVEREAVWAWPNAERVPMALITAICFVITGSTLLGVYFECRAARTTSILLS